MRKRWPSIFVFALAGCTATSDHPDLGAPSDLALPDLAVIDASCAPGQTFCATGCTTLDTDAHNCGYCGHRCSGGLSCCAGLCVDFENDSSHCGACDKVCSYPSCVAWCTMGGCWIFSCNTGHGDCDQDPKNGCEIDLTADNLHCGSCNHTCAGAHSTSHCQQGTCAPLTCDPGWADCDKSAGDGCEVGILADTLNCGGCRMPCSNRGLVGGACTNGACTGQCITGSGDCDQDLRKNGCETDLTSDAANCGGCGMACAMGQRCFDGKCQ